MGCTPQSKPGRRNSADQLNPCRPTNLEPTTSFRPSAGDIEKQLASQHLESKQKPVSELPSEVQKVQEVREAAEEELRLPRSVQALYLAPLKRRPEYGVPTCDLQLRSYSVHNLTFFADFALRAAYYLKLPASGPIPLPRLRQLWTVPRSNFVHKKSQENFERITMRRLIQIKDGHPDVVEIWLAFLTKHQYHGVGMKANVWDFERLGRPIASLFDGVGADRIFQMLVKRWIRLWRRWELAWSRSGPTLARGRRTIRRIMRTRLALTDNISGCSHSLCSIAPTLGCSAADRTEQGSTLDRITRDSGL